MTATSPRSSSPNKPHSHNVARPLFSVLEFGRSKTKIPIVSSSSDDLGSLNAAKLSYDGGQRDASNPSKQMDIKHRLHALLPSRHSSEQVVPRVPKSRPISAPPPPRQIVPTPHPAIPDIPILLKSVAKGSSNEARPLKMRIITWNMHDSVPKGDLEALLGSVPSYRPSPSPSDDLPDFPLDNLHPYHIIVVAGQECPTVSGLPMGIGAGLRPKEPEKEKEKKMKKRPNEDGQEKSTSLSVSPSQAALSTPSLPSSETEAKPTLESSSGPDGQSPPLSDSPLTNVPPAASQTDLNAAHALHLGGWSAILDDWFAKGVGSLDGVVPLSPNPPSAWTSTSPPSSAPPHSPHHFHGIPFSPDVTPVPHDGIETRWRFPPHTPGDRMFAAESSRSPNRHGPYELLCKERLMGIYLAIYVHRDVKPLVRSTSKDVVAAGLIGGRLGNKGGVGISVNIGETRLLFVNAHLAAHEDRIANRLANLAKIKAELDLDSFLPPDDPRIVAEDLTDKFDHTFLCGDLNFRLDVTRLHADWLISRKEYTQALKFDQLKKVMDTSSVFNGFREGPIDFPPTFKYDVLRTLKRPRLARAPFSRARSRGKSVTKVLLPDETALSEVEEDEAADSDDNEHPQHDGRAELEERASFSSSAYTLATSHDTTDGEDDDREEYIANTRENAKTKHVGIRKLIQHHIAHKARNQFLDLLNRNRSAADLDESHHRHHKHTKASKSQPALAPTEQLSAEVDPPEATSVEIQQNAASEPTPIPVVAPKLQRSSSSKSSVTEILMKPDEDDDGGFGEESDKGVYDSSHKQRVPSWCDRILWKSTIVLPEEGDDEKTRPSPTTRVGQFFQAIRRMSSGSRRSSLLTTSSDDTADTHRDDSGTSTPQLTSTPDESAGANLLFPFTRYFLPARPHPQSNTSSPGPNITVDLTDKPDDAPAPAVSLVPQESRRSSNAGAAVPLHGRPRSYSASLAETPVMETGVLPPSASFPPRRATTPIRLLDEVDSTSAPLRDQTRLVGQRRWFFPFPSFLTSRQTAEPIPSTPAPHKKGDVICLSYDALDDRAMRKLEGRSDHRPVVGVYAVYT